MAEAVPTIAVRRKREMEQKTITFDFGPEVAAGTTLTGVPLVLVETGITASAPVIDVGTGVLVSATFSGGVTGVCYDVACRAAGTDGQVHEIPMVLEIRED